MDNPDCGLPASDWKSGRYLEWYVEDPLVRQNPFLSERPSPDPLPSYEASKNLLPSPHWPSNSLAVQAYWKAWEIAWTNLKSPTPANGFKSSSIDTAFNDCLFLWDTVSILQFGRYGEIAFPFHRTLDNFYGKQHPDGFICREIHFGDGSDQWHRGIPFATGPNILAWAEWRQFEFSGDVQRLRDVYPSLAAYHRWTRKNRTWPDRSYWTTGLGSGMDNMLRVPPGVDPGKEHGWMTWTDATFQAILSGRLIAKICDVLGIADEVGAGAEAQSLTTWANERLWSERDHFYFDLDRNGMPLGVKSVAPYWALLAGAVPLNRIDGFVAHLANPESFNRHHRIPSLAADETGYAPNGDYWNGAIWPSTNYAILSGLIQVGRDDLAHEIAMNHYVRVLDVFADTGTFWENYAPESSRPGEPARRDFVGWSGIAPIAVLLEFVFGLRPDRKNGRLIWDIRLLDEHGVDRYPFSHRCVVDLRCSARRSSLDEPKIQFSATSPLEMEVRWKGGTKLVMSQ